MVQAIKSEDIDYINNAKQNSRSINSISSENIINQNSTISTTYQNTSSINADTRYVDVSSQNDFRVSLTAIPRRNGKGIDNYSQRLSYILGDSGLLSNAVKSIGGIIFPYTPSISGFGNQIEYDQLNIIHSNFKYNFFKNSSPNDITIKALFTADNRENALQMLSAIIFLRSCSKCEFGIKAMDESYAGIGELAGMPPPVLYLNGYGKLLDNIPVVIASISFDLPDTLHYVNLIINPDKNRNMMIEYTPDNEGITSNSLHYWLPTEMNINITLKVQPNIKKVEDEFSLDEYKKGELFKDDIKTNYVPSGWTW